MQPRNPPSSSRRGFMSGTLAAGAGAAAAAAIPAASSAETAQPRAGEPPKPEKGGGYRLSEHVKRYYRTTLI